MNDLYTSFTPIPMRLNCPGLVPDGHGGQKICGALHVDEGEFATKPHHTHACQSCGMTWRPAVVLTVGVRFLPGFRNEEAPSVAPAPSQMLASDDHSHEGHPAVLVQPAPG